MNPSASENDTSGLEIAIIGMAGRFPGAGDVATFWHNLCAGTESISFFADDAEASAPAPQPTSDSYLVKAGGLLDNVEHFDAAFFGFPPREAELTDPQCRLFLECVWEALEHAGYIPDPATTTIGVYAGAGANTYLRQQRAAGSDPQQVLGGMWGALMQNATDHVATLASYKLNLTGPSVAVQTACSTSLVAVHMACQSLLIGDCDLALAGGVSIGFPQKSGYSYHEGGIMSPDGHCRAFDAEARGTVIGDGVGVVVLKRLSQALADGDSIIAVIKGSAINNDGATKAGYTAPSVDGQAQVIRAAQALAEVDPATIDFIEAHGTGTALGDPIEVRALTKAFRAQTDRQGFCAIGSVKTNIGHLGAAAGVAGLIKTALALRHGLLPPSLHFTQPNPQIDFAASPFYVGATPTPLVSNGTLRRAGVSSFGIGGTNAHAILEEAPPVTSATSARPAQLLVLSAKTATALEAATANLAAYLEQNPDANLADVAYTLQVGRVAFGHRRMLVCRNAADAVPALQSGDRSRLRSRHYKDEHRQIVFLFPGQGTQYVQMAAELYTHEPIFRQTVDRCAELLSGQLDHDLRDIIYLRGNGDAVTGEALRPTALAQPALFVIEYALATLLQSWGITPTAMIGHSVGEYVAACLAGVFSLEDALRLIATRGQLIQQLPTGTMLVVPLAAAEVTPLLDPQLALAANNGPATCVVAGPADAMAQLEDRLARDGIECRRVHTSHAFHSSMMDPMLDAFLAQVQTVKLQPPQLRYISNVTGTWITAEEATDPAYWIRHLRRTVRFVEGMQELARLEGACFLEVGPGHTLSTLARQALPPGDEQIVFATLPPATASGSDYAHVLEALGNLWLSGVPLNWAKIHRHEQRRRVHLPTYPFERQRYVIELSPATAPAALLDKRSDLGDWFYLPCWQQAQLSTRSSGADTPPTSERWLIFLDGCGLGSKLAEQLRQERCVVTTVEAGLAFDQRGPAAYAIHPGSSDDYRALFRALRAQDQLPTTLLHLWSVTADEEPDSSSEAMGGYQERGFNSLLMLAQILGDQPVTTPLQLLVVANHLHDITGDERLIPAKATMLGPCRVIPQEYAHIRCRSIDIGRAAEQPESLALVARQLLAECRVPATDGRVAYRQRHRWVQRFQQVQLLPEPQPTRLRERGVYLITGGTSVMGLACAEYLSRAGQPTLVLLGRAAFPSKDQWSFWLDTHDTSDRVSQAIRRLQALEAGGAEVVIVSADITNLERMEQVIAELCARFGTIHGVIHAETVAGAGIIQLKTPELAARVLAPKVIGTVVLESVLRALPLDFLLLCSSTIALTGGVGQVDVCAANAFLDAYAQAAARRADTQVTAINWGLWTEDSAQDELASTIPAISEQIRQLRAAYGITPEEAVEALRRILEQHFAQVVVSTQDFEAAMAQSGTPGAATLAQDQQGWIEPTHARPESDVAYIMPRNAIEETVAAILGQLLGIQQIGVDDNFFALGGNSLLAIQLASTLRTTFRIDLHMSSLFDAGTVAEIAALVETTQAQQRQRDELEALLREIEAISEAEAEAQLLVTPDVVEESGYYG